MALIGADLGKSLSAVAAIRAAAEPLLEKGMYSLTDAVASLQSFSWVAREVTCEADYRDNGSGIPQKAVDIVLALKAFLIALVEEEVAEMLTRLDANSSNVELVIEGDDMELANQIVDLVKANTVLMEKAGARNSRGDLSRIQTIHDKAHELGATCASDEAALGKAAELEQTNERLSKAVMDALPRIEKMADEIASLRAARLRSCSRPPSRRCATASSAPSARILATRPSGR
ncbi:hypothetical protein ACFOON_15205 [Novosphingobium piscinae]|uniref:Uncharacterized protein n=1 Tax=Novosphingobium piscinae TaxID=1507448 RepID=A0A7X1FYJ7_9SPHN|nr:hypothetical protein [Novosphingobium piscinae]MBC2668752.1 hypothetical protein [Novosphingobium piscinae]